MRDNFEFGSAVLLDAAVAKLASTPSPSAFAGWYALRLAISRHAAIVRVGEPLYTKVETDHRKTGQQQFDYVDPRNRAVQIELEQAFTEHLKAIGAWLAPRFKTVDLDAGTFPVEASVIAVGATDSRLRDWPASTTGVCGAAMGLAAEMGAERRHCSLRDFHDATSSLKFCSADCLTQCLCRTVRRRTQRPN